MSRPSAPGSHLLESWPLSPVRWLDTQLGFTNCAWAVSAVAGLVGALDRWGGRHDISNLLMRDRPHCDARRSTDGASSRTRDTDAGVSRDDDKPNAARCQAAGDHDGRRHQLQCPDSRGLHLSGSRGFPVVIRDANEVLITFAGSNESGSSIVAGT